MQKYTYQQNHSKRKFNSYILLFKSTDTYGNIKSGTIFESNEGLKYIQLPYNNGFYNKLANGTKARSWGMRFPRK